MRFKTVLLCMVALFGMFLVADVPQAEARFGSRYASRSGWRPGKVLLRIRHANADRRQARRAEGRGLLPGVVARHRASCGSGSCGVTSQALGNCPSCPSTKSAAPVACPACPGGVCPNPN